jgi:flagellar protein FlaJ
MSLKIIFPKAKKKTTIPMTRFDRFTSISFRIFGWPATFISRRMPLLRNDILRSNMRVTPEGLVAVSLMSTLIASVVVIFLVYYGFFVFGIPYFLASVAALPFVFAVIVNSPKISASNRVSSLDRELPFVLGYISVLAGGGVSPITTIRRIAKFDKLFPAASREAKRILIETDIFGEDPITAIEKVARWNPSKFFAEFLYGYTSVLKTGGDFIAYIQSKLKDIMETKATAVKRSADTIGTLSEAYLTVTVILGMTLYTLYMVQSIIANSSSGLQNLYFFAFGIVPLISATFVWLLDAVQPKWPFVDYRPYKFFIFTAPVSVIFFFLPLGFPLYLRTAISLVIANSLPAVFSVKYARERKAIERVLPDFIRDVAEGRKTGLSPEISIERLIDRHYGPLSKHVRKMGSQLSWGVSLTKVVSTFTNAVGSWIAKAVGTLLIEVVDVGGGTVKSFSDMADFTRTINEMESERRSALRPFVYITYISGVMVVITTFILVYMLSQPAAQGFGAIRSVSPSTIDLLLTTAVFDSFVIGIVAGKMGESSVSDGFKHSIALVIVSVIAVFIAKSFIPIPV